LGPDHNLDEWAITDELSNPSVLLPYPVAIVYEKFEHSTPCWKNAADHRAGCHSSLPLTQMKNSRAF
jgi:hypothetical protein